MKNLVITILGFSAIYLLLLLWSGAMLFSYEEQYSSSEGEYYSRESMSRNERIAVFVYSKLLTFPIPGDDSTPIQSSMIVAVPNGICIGTIVGTMLLLAEMKLKKMKHKRGLNIDDQHKKDGS